MSADLHVLDEMREAGLRKLLPPLPRIGVGVGTCGAGNGAHEVFRALSDAMDRKGVEALLTTVGCLGYCAVEPLVNLWIPGMPMAVLSDVKAEDAGDIIDALGQHTIPAHKALCRIERWDHVTGEVTYGKTRAGNGASDLPDFFDVPFFAGQRKLVMRNCGLINPEDIEEYVAVGGYRALHKVLTAMNPDQVIDAVKKSRLRGRGGAGFPTGNKWEILRRAAGDEKFIICNADEGDPGAYMNRNEMESDPHALLEGMVIGAYAMGASSGIIYVRAEYPLAVLRLQHAIEAAREHGLLGRNILGSGFSFDIDIVEGAGAFVCGEETAMIASLEDRAGRPRPRPPFPGQRGLHGKPTNINNVETWFNIPVIIARGTDWFAQTGSEKSAGTKVFSLVGKVRNTGLVEMPLGAPLRQIVYDIGGGTGTAKRVKAVQTGGPSGGCIPARLFDSAVDYETLGALGSIMGSGGMVVMDEDNCMVDVARYFIEFSRSESCGKCVPCRVGLDYALRILTSVTRGEATEEDLRKLEELGEMVRATSLCGLGQTAPNPFLTTLKYFREEYLQHVQQRWCAASVCADLFAAPCQNTCPLHMNIPAYLDLIQSGRMEDACLSVALDNPLAGSTGRVCQHPCEHRCRRGDIDTPVSIRDLHRFVVDRLYAEEASGAAERLAARLVAMTQPATGKTIAIVGAGPAGLTAAFYLALLGHRVSVFDDAEQPGGMLRYALPEYRLPKSVLDREIDVIRRLGVEFVPSIRIGRDRTLAELEAGFDAVLLSMGTWKEVLLDVAGSDLPRVTTSIDFLGDVARRGPSVLIGQRTLVIGGGNSAIDSARTAARLGGKVTVVYRRSRQDMPAIDEEVEHARAEGVQFRFLAIPKRIVAGEGGGVGGLEVAQAELGPHDRFGRRTPLAGERTELIPCDTIIMALGQQVDDGLLDAMGIAHERDGTIAVDPVSCRIGDTKMYAAGDIVSGPANVVTAMGQGRRAAAAIDAALTGAADRLSAVLKRPEYAIRAPAQPVGGARRIPPEVESRSVTGDFAEVAVGMSGADAVVEATRCLRCDVRTTCAVAAPAAHEEAVT